MKIKQHWRSNWNQGSNSLKKWEKLRGVIFMEKGRRKRTPEDK